MKYFTRIMTGVLVTLMVLAAFVPVKVSAAAAQKILYYTNDRQIVSINPDGSGRQVLGTGVSPDISPDGTKVVFQDVDPIPMDGPKFQPYDIFIMNADGSQVVNLIPDAEEDNDTQPVWSPDGSHILFSRGRGQSTAGLYTMRPDGSDLRLVVPGVFNGSWSPDGNHVVFTYNPVGEGDSEIGTASITDGTHITQLTHNEVFDDNASWSPDGTRIAWTCDCDSQPSSIKTMHPDGTAVQTIVQLNGIWADQATWSPDSSTLAFTYLNSGVAPPSLYAVPSQGGQASPITSEPTGIFRPRWSRPALDATPPIIIATRSPLPNGSGWNNSDVTVSFTCNDDVSVVQCSPPVTISTETSGQVVTGMATDSSGNSSSTLLTVKLDKTLPLVSGLSVSPGVILFTGNLSISAVASDALSGIVDGEYFIDSDPGTGQGTNMSYDASAGKLTATKNVPNGSLARGRHTVFVRARDAAGNWSGTVSRTFIYV